MTTIYSFLQRYKPVISNAIILISLLLALITQNNNLRDAFLGSAFGAALIMLGESIINVRRNK